MKNKIRKRILALRKAMPESVLQGKSKKIIEKVMNHPMYQRAEIIFCYMDAKGEVKTRDLIEHAWTMGKKVAVPKVHGDVMEFYYIEAFQQLESGYFGIMEPGSECSKLEHVSNNSLVIMPGVAFDKMGNRIGYGRGYYDKYFSSYSDLYKMAIAYSEQIVEEIPADNLDVKADCVVTDENVWCNPSDRKN